jgi:hypothetical protein
MKQIIIAISLFVSALIFASYSHANSGNCIPFQLIPETRTIANENTVLNWKIPCKLPVFGYFVKINQRRAEIESVYYLYAPGEFLALGPFSSSQIFTSGHGKMYEWAVSTCLEPTCVLRSENSRSNNFFWLTRGNSR